MDVIRLERLCRASTTKFFLPEKDVGWTSSPYGERLFLPDDLLSIAGLPEFRALEHSERREVARWELASVLSAFIRFENVINESFGRRLRKRDPTDPEAIYALHVVEEEARHSRMFSLLIRDIGASPLARHSVLWPIERAAIPILIRRPALFHLAMLSVEEVTDHFVAAALEDQNLDSTVADVFRIHRIEESRHMDFARASVADRFEESNKFEKFVFRMVAPLIVRLVFELLVSPEAYERSAIASCRGDARSIWRRAMRARGKLRRECASRMRNVLADCGALSASDAKMWRIAGLED